jgi:hypothetical protein
LGIVLAWDESNAATKIRQCNPLRKKETAEQLSRTAYRSGKTLKSEKNRYSDTVGVAGSNPIVHTKQINEL